MRGIAMTYLLPRLPLPMLNGVSNLNEYTTNLIRIYLLFLLYHVILSSREVYTSMVLLVRGLQMLNTKYCLKHPDVQMVQKGRYSGQSKGWRCPACQSIRVRKDKDKWKQAAFVALGGKCNRCGEPDCRVLQVDHVNGDGAIERGKYNNSYTHDLSNSLRYREWFFSHLDRYQLLCANCHVLKSLENDELGRSKKWDEERFTCLGWKEINMNKQTIKYT